MARGTGRALPPPMRMEAWILSAALAASGCAAGGPTEDVSSATSTSILRAGEVLTIRRDRSPVDGDVKAFFCQHLVTILWDLARRDPSACMNAWQFTNRSHT